MGVTADHGEILRYGDIFRRIPAAEPALPQVPPLDLNTPLSGGLASVHELKAEAAADFALAKDSGIITAGEGLVHIGMAFPAFDRKGANAIRRLFPDPAPGADGGR